MSYNRYRKRDKSEINRKSEIGLGRVENYDSADISENVIHHVRDYLYTPLYLDIDHDRPGSYGVVKFLESGHTMFITTLCRASGESRVIYDTLCGSLVYDKPSDETDVSRCPINFNILGNYTTSPIFINSTITVTIYKEQLVPGGPSQIVTYIGIGMDDLSPFETHEVRSIGTNLHDYSLGSVDYINTVDAYDKINPGFLAQWAFRVSDQIRRERLAVPLYSEILGDYIYASDGSNYRSGEFDVATINEVPFCGVYKLTIDGQDARHITVPAKHRGDSREEAGIHQWEVLGSYPYLKYSRSDTKYQTFNSLSQENSLSDKGGLCYLSDFDDAEGQEMEAFLETLGYWINDNKKEENLSTSSVVTVGILKRFWSILKPLLNVPESLLARISAIEEWQRTVVTDINNNLDIIQNGVDDITINPIDNPTIPDPETQEPTEISKTVTLTSQSTILSLSSSSGSVSATIPPTGKVYRNMSNGNNIFLSNTATLGYSWKYDDAPIRVEVGGEKLSSNGSYSEVGNLDGTRSVKITLTDPVNTPSFSNRELILNTKFDDNLTASLKIYISYVNGNVLKYGALVDSIKNNVYLEEGLSTSPYYYTVGSTVDVYLTAEEIAKTDNRAVVYINPVISRNGVLEEDPASIISEPGTDLIVSEIEGQRVYEFLSSEIIMGNSKVDKTYSLAYENNNGYVTFMFIAFHIEPMDSYLDLDSDSLVFSSNSAEGMTVMAYSSYSVRFTNNNDWITCRESSSMTYYIFVSENPSIYSERVGTITFTNSAGTSKKLKVIQLPSDKYIEVSPINKGSDNTLRPGSSWSTINTSPDSFIFNLYVKSNIQFDVILDDVTYLSQSSTSGSTAQIPVNISGNQTTQLITHSIEIRSELGSINIMITQAGQDDEPVVSRIVDNVFHKEDAFDILRTEKILTVSCEQPDQISLLVSDNDLVAKIYKKTSDKLYIHCYPRTVKIWPSDKTVSLSINYKGTLAKEQDFVIEATTSTVGSYFNVSSTIESFEKSDINNQTIEITGFSMSGELGLRAADNRSSVLEISNPQRMGGDYNWSYYRWFVTIPKGKAPISKTPWTLELYNLNDNSNKYINIYEASDVTWDTTRPSDFQITAFGHSCIADGCEIMPIVYERRYMKSFIGTNDSPNSTSECIFPVIRTVHDLSRVSLGTSNYWSLSEEDGLLKYSTCGNCKQINEDQHNAITVTLDGSKECSFSSSMDTEFYNERGLEYVNAYGSECIESDKVGQGESSRYALLPRSITTINHICIELPNPIKYITNNASSPKFLPIPPDWKISVAESLPVSWSKDGYLRVFPMTSGSNKSFTLTVNSSTNWGTKGTYPGGGTYSVKFERSTILVIDEEQHNPQETGTIIYDQQDPNNENSLKWSGITLMTGLTNDTYQQQVGSRYFFNSDEYTSYGTLMNNGLGGVLSGAQIITDLNLTLNCAFMGNKFGSGAASGLYSTGAYQAAKIYDLETNEVLAPPSNNNYQATFLTNGIGSIPITVRASRGVTLTFGIAGICEVRDTESARRLMFVPYVRVSANKVSSSNKVITDYLLVKGGQDFGIGFSNVKISSYSINVECLYKLTRTIVRSDTGEYKYNVKIFSNSGITSGTKVSMNEDDKSGISNLLSEGYRTNGTLDFEIAHKDMCNIISYHISNNSVISGIHSIGSDSETPWYFYGEKTGVDNETKFLVQSYSYLRDLKVTVK